MAVDEERGSGLKTGMHRQGFVRVDPDQDETLPVGTVAVRVRPDAVQERFLELQDVLHVHAEDKRLGGGNEGISKDYVFEVIGAGGQNGGTLVDLAGIEEIEHGEVLDLEDLVHALEAESALAIEEV